MANASHARQRIEWMWKSKVDPCSSSELEEWRSFSDVSTAIIEEAFEDKRPEALLDDYNINFKHLLLISNTNENNQWPVKRMVNEQREAKLREERFVSDPVLPTSSWENKGRYQGNFLSAVRQYFNIVGHPIDDSTRQMVVERAAQGLIVEGKKMGKQKEGEWMAQQLLKAKNGTRQEVWRCCVHLYCMESFLYKKMNEWMHSGNENGLSTFGPYAFLLVQLRNYGDTEKKMTVYRGAQLSDQSIEYYCSPSSHRYIDDRDEPIAFSAFTSTSRNRTTAEFLSGNVLFVIDINCEFDGNDVSPYSEFPEEEHLLEPGFKYHIRSCNFDHIKKKWIIYLLSNSCMIQRRSH